MSNTNPTVASEMPDETYTLPQIAKLMKVDPSTVRYWVSEGHLPAHKNGRRWVVDRELVDDMVASRTKPARNYRRKQNRAAPPDPPTSSGPQRPGRIIADTIGPATDG